MKLRFLILSLSIAIGSFNSFAQDQVGKYRVPSQQLSKERLGQSVMFTMLISFYIIRVRNSLKTQVIILLCEEMHIQNTMGV